MPRSGSICVTVAAVLATAGIARAEGMLPNNATISWEKFFITEDGDVKEPSTPDARRQYLNFAHCACSKASLGEETTFQYEVKLSTTTGTNRPGEVWVGTQCSDDTLRGMMCRQLTTQTIPDIDTLAITPDRIEVGIYDAVNGVDTTGPCQERAGDAFVWILVDSDGDNTYDYFTNQSVGGTATSMDVTKVDTEAPPLPKNFDAQSGEGSIAISWDAPDSRATDIFYYQALCMDDEGMPAGVDEVPSPRYQTTTELCGLPQDFDLAPSVITGSEDGTDVAAAPEPFRQLNSDYLCGDQTSGTATSLTINGLENDKPYTVALLAIDYYGNVKGTYFSRTIIPKPVIDFWEDLDDRGSAVEGGCLLSTTYGEGSVLTQVLRSFRDNTLARTAFGRALIRAYYATFGSFLVDGSLVLRVIAGVLLAPLVVLAVLWHLLSLPGLLLVLAMPWLWRRRRVLWRITARLLPAPIATLLGICVAGGIVAPHTAHADDFTPYWDDDASEEGGDFEDDVTWHAGIRLGPYIPEIDLQAGQNALTGKGPYEAMFGDYYLDGKKHERRVWQVLPMLDVDRIIWNGFGQIGVGGSIGYMQKSAYAYVDGTSEDEAERPRSGASRNTFRLIPLAATVSYRFTYLDDRFGIPIVPYLRGGLSYYAWMIKAPNGDLSRVCAETAADMSCVSYNKARGGSLGYQGSIGLAVRAERIDSEAAMSMRNSGIQHAGFYAELQYAKVDGFGSDSRLSVGDNTWFAGVDFEF